MFLFGIRIKLLCENISIAIIGFLITGKPTSAFVFLTPEKHVPDKVNIIKKKSAYIQYLSRALRCAIY
jgi:hypothetical protein